MDNDTLETVLRVVVVAPAPVFLFSGHRQCSACGDGNILPRTSLLELLVSI